MPTRWNVDRYYFFFAFSYRCHNTCKWLAHFTMKAKSKYTIQNKMKMFLPISTIANMQYNKYFKLTAVFDARGCPNFCTAGTISSIFLLSDTPTPPLCQIAIFTAQYFQPYIVQAVPLNVELQQVHHRFI